MKLFAKYNRINLSAMTAVFLLSGVVYYSLLNDLLVDELDETLLLYKERISKYAKENNAFPKFETFDEVQIRYTKAKVAVPEEIVNSKLIDPEIQQLAPSRQLNFSCSINRKLYRVEIAKPLEGTTLMINSIALGTILMLLLIILISILLNHIILKKLWRPFFVTMQEMKIFKLQSKVIPKLPETEIDEFSFMNYSLNEMICSAKDDYRILKEFTENASHEIQTPLAIMRSKLDLVIQEEGLSESQTTALKSVYSGIHRLTKLNQSLLLLAKIENKQFEVTAVIDMQVKVQEKLDQFHELWQGNHITLVADLIPAPLQANAELIDVLLNNMLSNAGRHNLEGGEISVVVKPELLQISNTAKNGELNPDKIFTRFYKVDQHSQSNGLGLSIVKQICDDMKVDLHYLYNGGQHQFTFFWNNLDRNNA